MHSSKIQSEYGEMYKRLAGSERSSSSLKKTRNLFPIFGAIWWVSISIKGAARVLIGWDNRKQQNNFRL